MSREEFYPRETETAVDNPNEDLDQNQGHLAFCKISYFQQNMKNSILDNETYKEMETLKNSLRKQENSYLFLDHETDGLKKKN